MFQFQAKTTSKLRRARRPKKSGTSRRFGWKMRFAIVGLIVGGAVCALYASWAAVYDLRGLNVMPQRTWIYDYQGKPFSRRAGQDRVVVPISQVSKHFINALLAREDSRFYKHRGIDPIGIARAIFRNVTRLRAGEGASTITQQLARNSFDLGGRNLHRKLLEAFVALRIEQNRTKGEILECYVNRIFFGSGLWGVDTASRAYFGKPSGQLTLGEAAVLAGLIRSPNRFSPFKDLDASLRQRDTVLERMVTLKMITRAEADTAKAQKIAVSPTRPPGAEDGYAMDLIEDDLSLNLDSDQLAEGGLRVYTTLDPALQKAAEAALDAELAKIEERAGYPHPKRADFHPDGPAKTPYLQGAVLVLDNRGGGIRAIVGGRNYNESTFNRVYARRQVGSTFKPFVYAAAYASGAVTPSTPISDDPIRRRELRSDPNWSPGNSDGTFRGILPAEEGLVLSRNTMSVRVGDRAGLDAVRKVADDAGLGPLPNFPSIFLGSFDARLRDLVSAYTLFPNGGVRRQPFIVDRVEDAKGRVIYQAPVLEFRVLPRDVCLTVTSGLQKVMERGTGASSGFRKLAAGKTGTTNDYKDAWFVGYTRALTCGVWVGLDEPAMIVPRGYGATLALPVWSDVMNAASERYTSQSFDTPSAATAQPAQEGAQSPQEQRRKPLPSRIINSFRKLFGGGE